VCPEHAHEDLQPQLRSVRRDVEPALAPPRLDEGPREVFRARLVKTSTARWRLKDGWRTITMSAPRAREAHMLVPFGTRVVDNAGKGVGTVSRVVLHHQSRQVDGLVVHQGVLDRREIVVPIAKVAAFGDEVRLSLRASELAGLDLFHSPPFRAMPDHWDMPAGFDQRDFFLVGGDGWTEAVLPFEVTSPAVSGTRAYVRDRDAEDGPVEPDIAAGMHVYDNEGRSVGDVEAVEVDEVTRRITRIVVRRGFLFHTETTIPASMIASVTDRITLRATADAAKKLERDR
jgi:sporulation protein YlmC with PRC-barrel domain